MTNEELTIKIAALAGLKTAYEEAKAQFERDTAEARTTIEDMEAEIKEEVLARGETVKTDYMTVTWNKGKTSWDGKLLEGYALAHPDILAAKKVGAPTVSFRLMRK